MRTLWVVVARVYDPDDSSQLNWVVVDSNEVSEQADNLYRNFVANNPTYDIVFMLFTSYGSRGIITKRTSCYRDSEGFNEFTALHCEAIYKLFHSWLNPTPF